MRHHPGKNFYGVRLLTLGGEARLPGAAAIEIARNPFFCPDKDKASFFEDYLDGIRKKGSSIGAVIEIVAEGVPAGLGAPIDRKSVV